MKNMHVWPYFVSEGTVWFSDLCAGGLYTYDCEDEKVCCRIKSDALFSYGIFEIEAIACWKSFVFIFSEKLSGNHIVYDSLNGEIRTFRGFESDEHGVIHQAIVIGETLYLIPLEILGYIFSINLSVCKELNDSIWFTNERVGQEMIIKTWLPKSYGNSLYIPEHAGKRVFCIENNKIEVIDLDIPSELFTIGVYEQELWAAPLHGKYIVCLSMDGKEKERVEIPCSCAYERKSDICEIVPKDNFVFILHWRRPEIDIYNRKNKKVIQINGEKFRQPCEGGPGDEMYYLPYVMRNDFIRFFPSRCSMLEISLSNFTYRKKEFHLPTRVLNEEWNEWCRAIRRYRYIQKGFLNEKDGKGIETLIEDISSGEFQQKCMYIPKNSIEKNIYRYIAGR